MVVVWREGRSLLYGERGDGSCMERGEMVVVWRDERWLLYRERGGGCRIERGEMVDL